MRAEKKCRARDHAPPCFSDGLLVGGSGPPARSLTRNPHGPRPLCPGCALCPLPRRALMTPRSWIRKLFARMSRTVHKAPVRCPPAAETLETRLTPANAAFNYMQLTGAANPVGGIDVSRYSKPALGDLDGDGDLDLVAGEEQGTLLYFKNTGTAASPVFVQQTGNANP